MEPVVIAYGLTNVLIAGVGIIGTIVNGKMSSERAHNTALESIRMQLRHEDDHRHTELKRTLYAQIIKESYLFMNDALRE